MQEDQYIEFKETWRDEHLKWICGFANSQGGRLLIGINDNRTVIGIENSKELLEQLPNKVRDVLGIYAEIKVLKKIQTQTFFL